jgi:hypothetical protein
MSDKRSSSCRYGVHFKDQDIWIEQGLKIEDSKRNKVLPLCFDKMVKAIAHHFLHDDRDRKYYADSYSCRPPPLFILIITLIEVSVIMFDILKLITKYNMSSIFYRFTCLSNRINIVYIRGSQMVGRDSNGGRDSNAGRGPEFLTLDSIRFRHSLGVGRDHIMFELYMTCSLVVYSIYSLTINKLLIFELKKLKQK